MPLSRTERFHVMSQVIDGLGSDTWTFDKTNLLFATFGIETMEQGWNGPSIAELISTAPDGELIELASVVLRVEPADVASDVSAFSDSGSWKPGYVRLFISHSSEHAAFVTEIADELGVLGIHGFVAHETMTWSKPWQAQIEQALGSMHAFVVLVHPEVNSSFWCQEEIGWALGRRVPRFAVRIGANPVGFLGADQWPNGVDRSAKEVAAMIAEWLVESAELGSIMLDGLFAGLASAGNYFDAEAAAKRIAALGSLSDEQFAALDTIWWSNNQLYGGFLPTKVMEPFYAANGRAWPPPKPALPAPAPAPTGYDPNEEPF